MDDNIAVAGGAIGLCAERRTMAGEEKTPGLKPSYLARFVVGLKPYANPKTQQQFIGE